jgi:hypothetical protein
MVMAPTAIETMPLVLVEVRAYSVIRFGLGRRTSANATRRGLHAAEAAAPLEAPRARHGGTAPLERRLRPATRVDPRVRLAMTLGSAIITIAAGARAVREAPSIRLRLRQRGGERIVIAAVQQRLWIRRRPFRWASCRRRRPCLQR